MSMWLESPDPFGRSSTDSPRDLLVPCLWIPPVMQNVFCRYSSHYSSRFCFFDARAVACLFCHKAYACPMTSHASRTTTATFSVRPARKGNQGSTKMAAATSPPHQISIITARRMNSEKMKRSVARTHFFHSRSNMGKWGEDAGTGTVWAGGLPGTIPTWDLIGTTYAITFLLFRSEPIGVEQVRCALGCESVSSTLLLLLARNEDTRTIRRRP